MKGSSSVVRLSGTQVAVVAIVTLLAGALAAWRLPVAMYPTLARPAISVSCTYPGANAVELMNTVAGPIEEKMNGVEGMDRMTSSCYDTGAYSLTVNFAVGYDRDVALMKVQSKVQQALSLLPQEVKNTGVTVESGTTEELGILTLRSRNGEMTLDQVADYMFGVVNPAVLRVSGVGKSVVKGDKIAVRVWMQPDRLAAMGLASEDVVAAIKAQNVQASLGSVGALPSDGEERVMTLVSKGRLSSPEEFGEIVVATDRKGGVVRLKDVARIATAPQRFAHSALYDDTPAVYAVIYLLPGANPLQAMAEVKAELAKLEPLFPSDLAWDMTYDTTDYMKKALCGVAWAIAAALCLVFAALWAVTRSLRDAVMITLSLLVPSSLTAVTMAAADWQVNILTLYAFLASLAFAAGVAAAKGRGAVAAAAVVACAAIPLSLVDGVQGVLFRQFSFVFAVMAVAAALNAIFIVPAITRSGAEPGGGASCRRPFTLAAFCVFALLGMGAHFLAQRMPREFVPDEDMGVLYIDCKTDEGTPMAVTSRVMKRIYSEIRSLGCIEKCATLLGESIINGSGENQAKMLVVLKDWGLRGAGETSAEIARRMKKIADTIPEAEVFVLRIPPVKGMGNQGGVSVLLQAIGTSDPMAFSDETLRMRREFAASPLVESVTGGFYADTPHLRITIDRAKCELMGVPLASIYTVLQHNLGSIYVNDVNLGTQVNRVTAMADWVGRARPEDVARLYVRSKKGAMVPLGSLVEYREELGPRACYRCDQYLYCTEQFIPKSGVSTSEAVEEVRRICREKLSPGHINDWAGFTYESLKSRGDEWLLFSLAILLPYLVVVASTGGWWTAFCGLVPSVAAVFGAVLALVAADVSMSVYSRYALVMLVAMTTALRLLGSKGALPLLAALAALPLVFASGPGSAGSRSFGLALSGGFAAYALLLFLEAAASRLARTR